MIALFWPELDDAHARGALRQDRQELTRLRHALGRDVVLGEGSEAVGVDTGRLWCHAAAFEAALQAGELGSALKLWGGELGNGRFQGRRVCKVSLAPAEALACY